MPGLLAWLFLHPVHLPQGSRLLMLLPLVACVATVYRATRARRPGDMPRATVVSFLTITIGMVLIAFGFYAVHMIVQRYF
ncbi:MAG: hypothetical protein AB1716_15345 [Planctomycetota bacterium]